MNTVSLVQPNFQQGPKELNAHYLPYSVGVLWAYAKQSQVITDNFTLGTIQWKRKDIKEALTDLIGSAIVGFSTYVWNRNYNYELAKQLKTVSPDTIIMFGGPEPPVTDPNIFVRFPFIDYVIKGEGEITFKNMLENYLTNSIDSVPGLLINKNGTPVDTGESVRISDLDDLPSPYTEGIFDDIIAANPDIEWNSTLETNRGCPYQCTFCDWGSLTYNKVKKFNLERVFAELDWMSKNKCGHMSICDANFGMFVDRDNAIADKIISLQKVNGYPYTFNASWAKNQKSDVISIVKKLLDSPSFNHGLTLSVQSLDADVLDAIKRKNLDMNKIEEVFSMCEKEGIPVNTEFILGLPNETLTSWKNNFWRLFEAGNHTGIEIFQAQLLENAEMNTGQRILHKIKSQTVFDYMSGSYNDDALAEGVDVVTSTRSMQHDDMLDAQTFSWFINTFHINGVTTYASRFLHKYINLPYETFYDTLFTFLKTDEWFISEMNSVRYYYESWMKNGRINHPGAGPIAIHGWNLIHCTTINIHVDDMYSHLAERISVFLTKFNLPQPIYESLIAIQKNYVIQYNHLASYPKELVLEKDIVGYLLGSTLDIVTKYSFNFSDDKNMSFAKFLEYLYFSRRRNFGKAIIKREKNG